MDSFSKAHVHLASAASNSDVGDPVPFPTLTPTQYRPKIGNRVPCPSATSVRAEPAFNFLLYVLAVEAVIQHLDSHTSAARADCPSLDLNWWRPSDVVIPRVGRVRPGVLIHCGFVIRESIWHFGVGLAACPKAWHVSKTSRGGPFVIANGRARGASDQMMAHEEKVHPCKGKKAHGLFFPGEERFLFQTTCAICLGSFQIRG